MSLAINSDMVTHVLLVDGWHRVMEGSFDIDAYEIHDGGERGSEYWILRGGVEKHVPASGFRFRDPDEPAEGNWVCGPLTSVLALQVKRP